MQLLNGNSLALSLFGDAKSEGGDTYAKSGDAYGGDGGDAKASGGDADASELGRRAPDHPLGRRWLSG